MAESQRSTLWSPEALNDLDGIWDYYAGVGGRRTADDIIRRIGKIAALLEDQPLAGRTRDEIRSGIRSIAATPHIVFYRIVDARVEVVRVLDGRRDIDEIFAEDE
jgi:toxin ParE1/3/4